MSHHKLRNEKNCLNCGATVEHRYCGNCGQENSEPRQTFGHLIGHFFEDLTHYEGKFWPTLRFLFFRPAFLTKEFLMGKRSKYLPPVRLYIFASFITFLLPTLIPSAPSPKEPKPSSSTNIPKVDSAVNVNYLDTIATAHLPNNSTFISSNDAELNKIVTADTFRQVSSINFGYSSTEGIRLPTEFNSVAELDSAKIARAHSDESINFVDYYYHKKAIELKHNKYPAEEQLSLFYEALKHNFPKALFLYMPLFALVLRLFHKRKNWIYFDHGIFTLHYFSFMLLTFLLLTVFTQLGQWLFYLAPQFPIIETLWIIIVTIGIFWFPNYLFRAHRKMYGETWAISALKSSMILLLNGALFIVILCASIMITLFTMH